MATLGTIGPFSFAILNPLDGDLDIPQVEWVDVSKPWEDGVAYTRGASRAMPKRLQAVADLGTNTRFQLMTLYRDYVKLALPTTIVRAMGDGSTETWVNQMILKVELTTDTPYVAVASGGLTAGKWVLETIWTVQYTLGS